MLKEIINKYNANEIENKIHSYWDEINAYTKVREQRKGEKRFYFVDGPPYTTGHIHLGTAWNKVIKDSILRYRSMNGYDMIDRAGWDMHGLPIEVKVEELLGFTSKKDIESYGVGNFVNKCKEFALTQKDAMTKQFQSLGVWLNWDNPYMTLKDEYIEAAWWTLQQAKEKNLLEEGKRVVNWCPRCETAIADSEVEYEDREDPSIYAKFKLKAENNTFIIIWTTTPWTLPSNIAVAVNPKFEYAKVKAIKANGETEILIFALQLVKDVLKKGRYANFEILETMLGTDLVGLEYENPLEDQIPKQQSIIHKVHIADFVTAENTGCVHIAPGHGMDDFELGVKYNLPIFCPVGSDGRYTEEAGEYAGMHIREANQVVIDRLVKKGLLLADGKTTHRYGHCWRCKSPIIYLATLQWFLKIGELKTQMLAEIDKVAWHPEWAGSARFRDWVEGARDWCISRQRYWGIPIPVWRCNNCEKIEVIGTKQELVEKAHLTENIELHRPYVDAVTISCSCGSTMRRVEDVFDVWFDSAVASWATLNFPHHKEQFEQWWPADFITEGHDQTRGWFYSQLGASMVAFGRAPYKSVLMHGFTLDREGKKMSKSIGNVVQPHEVIDKYGADTLRNYVLSSSAPWDDLKFNDDEIANIHRTINILWNVYKFPLPYMVLDKFNPATVSLESVKPYMRIEDKWILSRMQSLIKTVDASMENYTLHRAIRAINDFILEDLSRWYVQLIRPRTWIEADDPDKIAVYRVLYEVFTTTAKVLAPFMPHLAEEMYQNLVCNVIENAPQTIHMQTWPFINEEFLDVDLEQHMKLARSIVEAASNARQKVGRKLRWPVGRIIITPANETAVTAVNLLKEVIMEQTNSKEIILTEIGETWDELGFNSIPNAGTIGPVFKGNAGKVIAAIKQTNGTELKKQLTNSRYQLKLADGSSVTIQSDMVNFEETMPQLVGSAQSMAGIVYVDAQLTRALESEGYAREVIRRVQDMRKEMDLAVEENIKVCILIDDEHIVDLILDLENHIANEVRANIQIIGFDIEVKGELIKDWDVEGIKMHIGISKME